MKTTKLGAEIVREAMRQQQIWVSSPCSEKSNKIKCSTSGDIANFPYADSGSAWCANFATNVVNNACKKLGITNKIGITASTKTVKSKAVSNGVAMDKQIAVGAIAWRSYNSSSGHVAIVVQVTNDYIITIEGNAGDSIKIVQYTHDKFWKGVQTGEYAYNGHYVIHTEQMGGEKGFTANNPFEEVITGENVATGGTKETNDDHQNKAGAEREDGGSEMRTDAIGSTKKNFFIKRKM